MNKKEERALFESVTKKIASIEPFRFNCTINGVQDEREECRYSTSIGDYEIHLEKSSRGRIASAVVFPYRLRMRNKDDGMETTFEGNEYRGSKRVLRSTYEGVHEKYKEYMHECRMQREKKIRQDSLVGLNAALDRSS